MKRLGARRVLVVTDSNLTNRESLSVMLETLHAETIDPVMFDQVRIELTSVGVGQ